MQEPLGIGVVGCGDISEVYFANLGRCPEVRVSACTDLDRARAEDVAHRHDVAVEPSADSLASRRDVQIVLNLTHPEAHAEIARIALRAGKHFYTEKPLATRFAEGQALLVEAKTRQLRIGCAPDTFLGPALQTAQRLIQAGAVGDPIGGTAFMVCRGHEGWHPNPEFYYREGGGPLLDMGPYYLTALIQLLGPVRRVTGSARRSFPARVITSEPRRGETIDVQVATHLAAVLDFECGAIVSMIMSFDIHAARLPHLEIHGSRGSLALPDPNQFSGTVELFDPENAAWHEQPCGEPVGDNARGLGVLDLARAILSGQPHRASGEVALHVLEIADAVVAASTRGAHVELRTSCLRPALVDG